MANDSQTDQSLETALLALPLQGLLDPATVPVVSRQGSSGCCSARGMEPAQMGGLLQISSSIVMIARTTTGVAMAISLSQVTRHADQASPEHPPPKSRQENAPDARLVKLGLVRRRGCRPGPGSSWVLAGGMGLWEMGIGRWIHGAYMVRT